MPTRTPTNTPTNTAVVATGTSTPTATCVPETPVPIVTPAFTPGPGCSSTPPPGVITALITDHPTTTTAVFHNYSTTCSYPVGLASYRRLDNHINNQLLYDYALAVIPPNSTLTLTVNNPTCAYQADAFYGALIVSFAGGDRYGDRLLDDTSGNGNHFCTVTCPQPSPTATARPSATPTPCSLCNLDVTDVTIACATGGEALATGQNDGSLPGAVPTGQTNYVYHWTATVHNSGDCTVTTTWVDNLQLQRNNRNFNTVLQQTGTGTFPPGDTVISGDYCFSAPHNTTGLRQVFKLTGTPSRCRVQATSSSILPCPGPSTCQLSFPDVLPDDPAYVAVSYLASAGVLSGYADGTFHPYTTTTRGQLAKIVVGAMGWALDTTGGPHFADVVPSNAFYPYVETAYNHGVVSGYADGTFRWGANVTRAQLAKIVVLAAGWALDTSSQGHFRDVTASNPFYAVVETAYANGVINGYADGTFRPVGAATRGQLAQVVYAASAPSDLPDQGAAAAQP